MRVAVASDERTSLTESVIDDLRSRGHEVIALGPLADEAMEWAEVGRALAESVTEGDAQTGVGFCWTGTGLSIAANKITGARAALCTDAETARGARRWNDANIVVMSLRLTSPEVASEILDAWFDQEPDADQRGQIELAT